jgi:hypothetical protein
LSEAEELWPDTVTCDDISGDDDVGSPPASFKLPLAHPAAKFDCALSSKPTYAKNTISQNFRIHITYSKTNLQNYLRFKVKTVWQVDSNIFISKAITQLRQFVTGFPPRWTTFEAVTVHVEFVVVTVTLGQVFYEYFGFLSQPLHRLLHTHHHPRLVKLAKQWLAYQVGSVSSHHKKRSFPSSKEGNMFPVMLIPTT